MVDAVLALDPDERAGFLREACPGAYLNAWIQSSRSAISTRAIAEAYWSAAS